jgi:hypothetical protein
MEIDASDFAMEVVLCQEGEGRRLRLIVFYSKTISNIEINYKIHDKELLAIVDSFQEWCHLLEDALYQVTIYSNHKILNIL